MHFVIFGLTLSSSWGNGHTTLWRGLLKALARRGHTAVFYEKDVSYYADTRDGWQSPRGIKLRLYSELTDVVVEAARELKHADVAMVTSFCPDGIEAARLVLDHAAGIKAFYDLDTPVTLDAFHSGRPVPYILPEGLRAFDLVLSYTGGRALTELETRLGAKQAFPLYGWVDPESHRPAEAIEKFRCELNYLGTYAADRQAGVEELMLKPATQSPGARFIIAGAQYPDAFPWTENIYFVRHLAPEQHPAFFCSGRATLNVTRQAMAAYGFCPSGRLFEAAACGTPIVTDTWEGLDSFFDYGTEILPVSSAGQVLEALALSDGELRSIAEAARARTLQEHTADSRAAHLEELLNDVHAKQYQTLTNA